MALITPALLNALSTGYRKTFQDAYEAMRAETFFEKVATTVPSGSASNTYGWLGDFPALREWVGARVVKDMKAEGYEIVNKLYEATVGIARTDIEDDNFGIYAPRFEMMAQEAAQHPDRMISALLAGGTAATCYDGQYFFDTDHPVYPNADGTGVAQVVSNYATGTAPAWYLLDTRKALKPLIFQERTKPELESKTDPRTSDTVFETDEYRMGIRYRCNAGYGFWQMAYRSELPLTADNFAAARLAMRKLKADGGRPLGINPDVIVVNADNEAAADQLFNARTLPGGGDNPNYGKVKVVLDPWAA